MTWLDRQSFLGPDSEEILNHARVGILGLGGGGSHVAQQLAHVGIGHFVIADPDVITSTNLNRLVGGTQKNVEQGSSKIEIAKRLIRSINPDARVSGHAGLWQEFSEELRRCDIIVGGLDSVRAKDEADAFCRRFMIPYIDMGMDVFETSPKNFLISGQVVLTGWGQPCLRCLGIVTEEGLAEEAGQYGAAGGRPQVVWPNGLLASSAVGLAIQILTPWSLSRSAGAFLEYDGNKHELRPADIFIRKSGRTCPHYNEGDVGDPFFSLADLRDSPPHVAKAESAVTDEAAEVSVSGKLSFFMGLKGLFLRRCLRRINANTNSNK